MPAPDSNGDLLTGAEEIAKFLNVNPRRAFHLLEKGLIPGFRLGKRWCARRSRLTRFFEEQEQHTLSAGAKSSVQE